LYIPEWEIEELLVCNPEFLGFPSKELKLVERQKYLKKSGRYIDLLFKRDGGYLIVEIKSIFVKDKSVITDQLIPYSSELASELGICEDGIMRVLISPNGFSEDVEALCQEAGVITRTLDQNSLIKGIRKLSLKNQHLYKQNFARLKTESKPLRINVQETQVKTELAGLFLEISKRAPIQAHKVGIESDRRLTTNRDMWFWLFYSVMDRRANAVTFVKAKDALDKKRIFAPYKIVGLVKTKGENPALRKIAKILEDAAFPLLNDRTMGKLSFPKSIVDAARFMSSYTYSFTHLYENYLEAHQNDMKEARDSLWQDLQKKIYGVGPRIASQIIRGMVLKGPWKFPLDDNRFLEKCRFNVWIAGKTRLGLITDENEYYEQMGKFADDFLDGNRGIVAHVLWYIRKRYCNRPPKCEDCKLSNYCKRAFSFST
jgi:hypothetical protein